MPSSSERCPLTSMTCHRWKGLLDTRDLYRLCFEESRRVIGYSLSLSLEYLEYCFVYIYIFVSASLSSWWPMYRLMRIVLSTSVSRLLGVTELNLDVDVSVLGDKAVLIRTVWIKREREIIKLESNEIKWLCA